MGRCLGEHALVKYSLCLHCVHGWIHDILVKDTLTMDILATRHQAKDAADSAREADNQINWSQLPAWIGDYLKLVTSGQL